MELFTAEYFVHSLKLFFKVMFVFICFASVLLIMSPAIFNKVSNELQKQRGFKKQVSPWFETNRMEIDNWLYKNRNIIAPITIVVSIVAFFVIH